MTGTERKKWTLADLFLIFLAVLSLLGMLLRFVGLRRSGGDDFSDYEVEMIWKNVDLRTATEVEDCRIKNCPYICTRKQKENQ